MNRIAVAVAVAGKLVERDGKPALAVSGSDVVYALAEGADGKGKLAELRKSTGKEVIVKGHLPESTGTSAAPQTLELRDFSLRAIE